MLTLKEAELIYNKLKYYETSVPWWQLRDYEHKYYQWLFAKDEFKGLLTEPK